MNFIIFSKFRLSFQNKMVLNREKWDGHKKTETQNAVQLVKSGTAKPMFGGTNFSTMAMGTPEWLVGRRGAAPDNNDRLILILI